MTGKLYDQCQDTLVQFGTFLGSTMTVDEYVERLPSIHSMLQDNHIHADVAFFLARPMFAHAINVSMSLNFFYNINNLYKDLQFFCQENLNQILAIQNRR